MNAFFTGLDAVLCILVVVSALEYLRAVDMLKHPVLATAFYLVAIGAFGLLVELLRGDTASPFAVVLHLGVVVYAWARRQYIFTQDSAWHGPDRRKAHR